MRDLTVDEHRLLEASRSRWETERAARRCREIAAQAQDDLRTGRPCRGLLLASEAFRRSDEQGLYINESEQVLRDSLGKIGGIGLGGHSVRVNDLAFDPNGRWLATSSTDQQLRLWPVTALESSFPPCRLKLDNKGLVRLAFDPLNQWLVGAGNCRGTVFRVSLQGSEPASAPVHLWDPEEPDEWDSNWCLAWSPDAAWLAIGKGSGRTLLWSRQALDSLGDPICLGGHRDAVSNVAFDPRKEWLATASQDATVRLWPLSQADPDQCVEVLCQLECGISCIAFSPGGDLLAIGCDDNVVRYWSRSSWKKGIFRRHLPRPHVLSGHTGPVLCIAFDIEGRWLASGGADATARLWPINGHAVGPPFVLQAHDKLIRFVNFDPKGRWLATASHDGRACLWPWKLRIHHKGGSCWRARRRDRVRRNRPFRSLARNGRMGQFGRGLVS